MAEETVLEEAQRLVHGQRGSDYGPPSVNHGCTADLFASFVARRYGITLALDATDVCVFNLCQKLSRLAQTPLHRDTVVDICGYAANIEMLWQPVPVTDVAALYTDIASG